MGYAFFEASTGRAPRMFICCCLFDDLWPFKQICIDSEPDLLNWR